MSPRVFVLTVLSTDRWTPIVELAERAREAGYNCAQIQGALNALRSAGAA